MARRNILYKSKKTTFIAGSAGQPPYARSEAGMIPLSSGGAGTTGEIGGSTVSLAAFDGLSADHAYGEI